MRREIKFTPMLGLLGAAVLAAAMVILPARPAQAYGDGIDINKFHPAPGNEKILTVDLADVGPHLQVVPQLFLHYSYRPLVYTLGGVPQADLVKHRLTGDLSVSIALWRRLQIAIALPVTFYQAGETPSVFVPDPNNPSGKAPNTNLARGGQEDIHLLIKGVFWNNRTFEIAGAHFGVGGVADLSLPSGNAESYLGARLPTLALKAVGSVNFRRLTASLMFGGLFQSSDPAHDQLYDVKSGLGIVFGGGMQLEMFRYKIMPFYILAEVFGASVLSDPKLISPKNTPAELTIAFKTSYKEWTFMLGGGPGVSPGAGVPDGRVYAGATYAWQKIPQRPKMEKVHDECPNLDGAQPGLPPGMIHDADGKCIPEPDECPNLPGAQAKIPDGQHKDEHGNCVPPPIVIPPTCGPDQIQTPTGCEEKPKPPVKIIVTKTRLILSERIFFDFDKDTIKPVSFPILDEVVRVLKALPEIKRMRIEGHTDNKGSDSYNLDLSHRRAASVMVYLIEHGVETHRLTSSGFGFRCPIVPNDGPDPRAKNRRVDFIILEQEGVTPEAPKCKVPQMPRR